MGFDRNQVGFLVKASLLFKYNISLKRNAIDLSLIDLLLGNYKKVVNRNQVFIFKKKGKRPFYCGKFKSGSSPKLVELNK